MKKAKKYDWIKPLLVYGVVVCCALILISLCFNEGLDYDESFSYSIIRDNSFWKIPGGILASPYNDVIPFWYMALKLWTCIFGESFVVCKFFTVAGSVATMLLGATVIRRNWGCMTAVLFIIPAGLAPGLMHVGVNIRTYSWTVFLMTATALIAYKIVENYEKKYLWVLLFLTTIVGLFCHHFTAFCYLFIYLYLFVELLRCNKKQIWKIFVCGILAIIPFCVWLVVSDFFSLKEEGDLNFSKLDLWDPAMFSFSTSVPWSIEICLAVFGLSLLMLLVLRKRFKRAELRFSLLCMFTFVLSYIIAALVASGSSHFIVPRHTMHAMALVWLALAIILPKINRKACVFGFVLIVGLCASNYVHNYEIEYDTIPYLEETKAFVRDNMQPGDTIIFNVEEKFGTLYSCHMPEQNFVHLADLDDADIERLAGERVWYFLRDENFFSEEQQIQHGITYENMGHYGFQIIDNCTDFDILKVEIAGGGK